MNIRERQEAKELILLDRKARKSSESKRWKEEKKDDFRTEYQRDIGRILFSDAFRRLRMKTQVFLATPTSQHTRTRLTHSLEVSQMARSISTALNLNNDLVEAIALGHDLGHTPFGHAGEKALNICLKETVGTTFNHNAQSAWLVMKTMSNRTDIDGNLIPGFNLTFDVVEGIWKHTKIEKSLNDFEDLKKINSLNYKDPHGSLEAQIVNLSDGIAYIRHDIEDAVREKIITYEQFESEVWNKHFHTKFDSSNWINYFIYDLIDNNMNLDRINFSTRFEKIYNDVKNFIFKEVIQSQAVKNADDESVVKVITIFRYCVKNPDYIAKKCGDVNKYKINKYGVERAVTDYIQWCGDELAKEIYEHVKNK